jgi:tetratricopeptide (TPR) repeat protein
MRILLSFALLAIIGWGSRAGFAQSPATKADASGGAQRSIRSNDDLASVFETHKPPLTGLLTWAKNWWASRQLSHFSSDEDLCRLDDLVEQSGLGSRDLLAVGTYILAQGDKGAAAVWFRHGIEQTANEFDAAKARGGESQQEIAERVIRPLLDRGLDSANGLLAEDRTKNERALEKLLAMEIPLKRLNQWDQRPEWVRIGHAESLFNQQRFGESIVEIDQLEKSASVDGHFTQDEKTQIHWNRAIVLYQLRQFDEALAELRIVTARKDFKYGANAWSLLVTAFCELHRSADAESALKQFHERFAPSASAMASMSSLVDEAKYNEEWDKSHAAGGKAPSPNVSPSSIDSQHNTDRPSTQPNWKARFLSEAPPEWKRLETAVGGWDVRDQVDIFSRFGETKTAARLRFDARVSVMRFESHPISSTFRFVDPRTVTIIGSNAEYDFVLDKDPNESFRITEYTPGNGDNRSANQWSDLLDTGYELVAEDLDGYRLPALIAGIGGQLKSVTSVQVDGKTMVRLDFDRLFEHSHKPYPGWAIVDPSFHWAVKSYEVNYGDRIDTGTVEYRAEITNVAFPRRILDQELNPLRILRHSRKFDFQMPRPSDASAREFMLEDFGLKAPSSAVHPRGLSGK